ncbi:hexitol phosphatase HxpB [Fluviispira sanaruensis]|uniref:Haloacid dehalogenase superfamily protein n=1 Tax=Fluviispira sanaruensis TaxID=2493639 RepID=A0A4P2VXI2_FLUSA|nr:hexitol phosphatase HxpB [Fluviispira sanaruensis]BBH54355.1 haloacid dehalogenase superfamily protein [Fluviispira sanaruensis]
MSAKYELKENLKVIFDMDGVIIDSEPIWQEAEIEVFKSVGLNLDRAMCQQTSGYRMDAAVDYWFKRQPWTNKSKLQVENEVKEIVCKMIVDHALAKPGAINLIHELAKNKITMAICSSSSMKIIKTVCEKLNITSFMQIFQTGEDCSYGKPHPEPYLATAKRLNALPSQCIVIEDSLTGAISGKSAGMKVIAVPEEHNFQKTIFDFCDAKYSSLENLKIEDLLNIISH